MVVSWMTYAGRDAKLNALCVGRAFECIDTQIAAVKLRKCQRLQHLICETWCEILTLDANSMHTHAYMYTIQHHAIQ